MTLAALLVALYAFIAGLVAGWVMQPDAPATRTPASRDPLPWWLGIAFGLAWPVAATVLVLLVGPWWLDGWRPDPRDAAPSRPAGRGTSQMDLT